jgi:hypothetical protein
MPPQLQADRVVDAVGPQPALDWDVRHAAHALLVFKQPSVRIRQAQEPIFGFITASTRTPQINSYEVPLLKLELHFVLIACVGAVSDRDAYTRSVYEEPCFPVHSGEDTHDHVFRGSDGILDTF